VVVNERAGCCHAGTEPAIGANPQCAAAEVRRATQTAGLPRAVACPGQIRPLAAWAGRGYLGYPAAPEATGRPRQALPGPFLHRGRQELRRVARPAGAGAPTMGRD